MTHYMKHSLLGTRRVISSIITRNFFVTRNKQPMTIGTNRMCISRDDNCANTMCFPRQLPTTARKLFTLENCSPPRTVLSNKSHDKVDFHVLFQYKPRSLSFTTNTFASTQLSLSIPIVLFFFFNPHPISYTRIDLRKKPRSRS